MKIELRQIEKNYFQTSNEKIEALKGINILFDEPRKIIGIVGENGSGKSTFVKLLSLLLKQTTGNILIDDTEIILKKTKFKIIKALRNKISLTFQNPDLQIFGKTVEKDIKIWSKLNNESEVEIEKKFQNVINKFNLKDLLKSSPFSLSYGQKSKVIISGLLMKNLDVIIFDEPTANLDSNSTKYFFEIIKELKSKGKTIVVISHNIDNILSYTDNLMVFKQGRLIKFDKTMNVLNDLEKHNDLLKKPDIIKFYNDLIGRKSNCKTMEDLVGEIRNELKI